MDHPSLSGRGSAGAGDVPALTHGTEGSGEPSGETPAEAAVEAAAERAAPAATVAPAAAKTSDPDRD